MLYCLGANLVAAQAYFVKCTVKKVKLNGILFSIYLGNIFPPDHYCKWCHHTLK